MATYDKVSVQEMGLDDVPAIPRAGKITIGKMLLIQLASRAKETKKARQGLSTFYTIGDDNATALEFMYGKSKPLISFAPELDAVPAAAAPAGVASEPIDADEVDPAFDPSAAARDELLAMLDADPDQVLDLLDDEAYLKSDQLAPVPDKETLDPTSPELPEMQAMAFFNSPDPLTTLSLVKPEQWAMSWTTLDDIYQDALLQLLPTWVKSLTDADEASKQFWPTIANHGLAYNLLILQKVGDAQIPDLKRKFAAAWTTEMEAQAAAGLLYAIDMRIFTTVEPQKVDGFDRFTPATITLLMQDPQSKALTPIAVRVSGHEDKDAQVYVRGQTTSSAWLYALQAAKTSITVYGVWLGHVYHWHVVTAAMQMTREKTIPAGHVIDQLLAPQSKYLIAFDTLLLLLWKKIAPPTSISTRFLFLELCNTFAKERLIFDDDPVTALQQLGIKEEDFSLDAPWDQYPIVAKYLNLWAETVDYVNTFVDVSYADDSAVADDRALQEWITASADRDGGNIRGLPTMDNKDALKRVLTSLIYRVTMHGASRLPPVANPALTFVANFPPCLQETSIPRPDSNFDTEQLLKFMPKTGVIGEMTTFYFTFAFSSPYEPFIPADGAEADLFFPGEMSDLRNQALVKYRQAVIEFTKKCYGPNHEPQLNQWPMNIET